MYKTIAHVNKCIKSIYPVNVIKSGIVAVIDKKSILSLKCQLGSKFLLHEMQIIALLNNCRVSRNTG
jgi:hypothetical protein